MRTSQGYTSNHLFHKIIESWSFKCSNWDNSDSFTGITNKWVKIEDLNLLSQLHCVLNFSSSQTTWFQPLWSSASISLLSGCMLMSFMSHLKTSLKQYVDQPARWCPAASLPYTQHSLLCNHSSFNEYVQITDKRKRKFMSKKRVCSSMSPLVNVSHCYAKDIPWAV